MCVCVCVCVPDLRNRTVLSEFSTVQSQYTHHSENLAPPGKHFVFSFNKKCVDFFLRINTGLRKKVYQSLQF